MFYKITSNIHSIFVPFAVFCCSREQDAVHSITEINLYKLTQHLSNKKTKDAEVQ